MPPFGLVPNTTKRLHARKPLCFLLFLFFILSLFSFYCAEHIYPSPLLTFSSSFLCLLWSFRVKSHRSLPSQTPSQMVNLCTPPSTLVHWGLSLPVRRFLTYYIDILSWARCSADEISSRRQVMSAVGRPDQVRKVVWGLPIRQDSSRYAGRLSGPDMSRLASRTTCFVWGILRLLDDSWWTARMNWISVRYGAIGQNGWSSSWASIVHVDRAFVEWSVSGRIVERGCDELRGDRRRAWWPEVREVGLCSRRGFVNDGWVVFRSWRWEECGMFAFWANFSDVVAWHWVWVWSSWDDDRCWAEVCWPNLSKLHGFVNGGERWWQLRRKSGELGC